MDDGQTRVLYNEDCPVCRFEINQYRSYSKKHDLAIQFDDLNSAKREKWNISPDQAAKRLHVFKDGVLYDGIPAFLVIWDDMPRYKWLAKFIGLPVIRPLSIAVYDWILAPALYAWHKRRVQNSAVSK